jgi:hypothetical protein
MLDQPEFDVGVGALKALGKTFHAVKNDLLMTRSAHGHHR